MEGIVLLGFNLSTSTIILDPKTNPSTKMPINFPKSTISEIIHKRVQKLTEFIQNSKNKKKLIIFSGGGKGRPTNFSEDMFISEAEVLKQMLVWRLNQQKDSSDSLEELASKNNFDFLLEAESFTTIDNALNSFEKISEYVQKSSSNESTFTLHILTNKFHSRRAFMLFYFVKLTFEDKFDFEINLEFVEAENPSEMDPNYRETIDDEYIYKQLRNTNSLLISESYKKLFVESPSEAVSGLEMVKTINDELKSIFQKKKENVL